MISAVQYRSQQLSVRAVTLQHLMRIWRAVDVTRLKETIGPFADAAAIVVGDGYTRSARVASAYYLTLRPRGITTLTVPTLSPPAAELLAEKLRAAAISGIVNGRRAGQTITAAAANGFVKTSGTASSLVLAGGRNTIIETAKQDPAATGKWQRVAGPDACEFCIMLQDRGAVYSDQTATFASHDHCGCAVAPEFTSQ